MLYQWIVGQHEHAKPPTVENLKQALRSQTVNLGAVARHLDDDLIKHGIYLLESSRVLLTIFFQTLNIVVEEGKSTLLEVHAREEERETHCLHT